MDTSLLLIVLAVAAVAALLWKRQQGMATRQSIKDSDKPWPFAARSVLTEREREMFRTLQEALHPHYIVLSQVDMKQVLRIKDRRNERRWRPAIAAQALDVPARPAARRRSDTGPAHHCRRRRDSRIPFLPRARPALRAAAELLSGSWGADRA